jgi:CubicO group peptidase (beta-lactamase class C family)
MGHLTTEVSSVRLTRPTLSTFIQSALSRWPSLRDLLFPAPEEAARRLMDAHGVSALSLAIAKSGSIVFSAGYGVANPATAERATADSLYRIASNSKAITSAAIHVLIDQRRLSLGERVFGDSGILGHTYGTKPYTNWLVQIDVGHLLEHTAGGWGNETNDPMFLPASLDHAALITQTLDADLLQRPSGVQFIYSNFGFCLLGRIIEKKTGMRYEDFVRTAVLNPAGAGAMRLAQDTLAGRAAGEVVYTSTGGAPYSQPVRRMDAHGGWIGSAPDYVRFLLATSNPAAGVLSPASIASMRQPYTAAGQSGGYGKGVGTNGTLAAAGDRIYHNGLLTGSRSVMWAGAGGNAWAVHCTGGPAAGSKKSKSGGDPLLEALGDLMWYLWGRV